MPAGERTRARRLLEVVPLVVLVGVAAVLVAVRLDRGPGTDPVAPTGAGPGVTSLALPSTADAPALLDAVAHVPASVLDQVGTGGVATVPIAVNGSAVTGDGRPRVIWVGSEDCAPCAAMRWSMVVALSRFGELSGVGLAASATDAPYPGTIGPTFRDARFSSDLVGVTFYESQVYRGPNSRPVTATDRGLLRRYDAPPYVTDDNPRPFVLFAGQYVSAGSLFTPGVLDGLDAAAIAAAAADPDSAAGTAIDGAANVITAVLCVTTDGRPGEVCDSRGVVAARAVIGTRVN
ncbi:DUF929 family protein [Jatrophihabitans sp. YIM 134969]